MMSVKILVVLIIVATATKGVLSVERIVGGQIAEPNSIPFQVAMFVKHSLKKVLLCGGSLINEKTVLTAAHCLEGSKAAVVIIGAHNLTANETGVESRHVNSSDYRIHPQFNILYANLDIALVILPIPVTFSDNIQPVQLPSQRFIGESFAGEVGTVSGFGLTCDDCGSSQVLRYTVNRVMTDDDCSKRFTFSTVPSDTQVCTTTADNNSGNCRGDSGGPLTIIRNEDVIQIGLSSFGYRKCQEGQPTVFTRLTPEIVQWINKTSSQN